MEKQLSIQTVRNHANTEELKVCMDLVEYASEFLADGRELINDSFIDEERNLYRPQFTLYISAYLKDKDFIDYVYHELSRGDTYQYAFRNGYLQVTFSKNYDLNVYNTKIKVQTFGDELPFN